MDDEIYTIDTLTKKFVVMLMDLPRDVGMALVSNVLIELGQTHGYSSIQIKNTFNVCVDAAIALEKEKHERQHPQ